MTAAQVESWVFPVEMIRVTLGAALCRPPPPPPNRYNAKDIFYTRNKKVEIYECLIGYPSVLFCSHPARHPARLGSREEERAWALKSSDPGQVRLLMILRTQVQNNCTPLTVCNMSATTFIHSILLSFEHIHICNGCLCTPVLNDATCCNGKLV